MNQSEQNVSTESQRLALEAMSANLAHKLNLMIQEQEERAREFAASHRGAPVPLPQTQQPVPKQKAPPTPPAPSTTRIWETAMPHEPSLPRPAAKRTITKQQPQQEDGNIGMGMVIFALVGIILLIRSCT